MSGARYLAARLDLHGGERSMSGSRYLAALAGCAAASCPRAERATWSHAWICAAVSGP